MTRGVDDLLADLAEAVDAAAELVNLGKQRWDSGPAAPGGRGRHRPPGRHRDQAAG